MFVPALWVSRCGLAPAGGTRVELWPHLLDVPLAVDFEGNACTLRQPTDSFRKVAEGMGQATAHTISGHSGRTSGAQMFAAAGVGERIAALCGRWGSASVRRYAMDADHKVLCKNLAERVATAGSFRDPADDAAHSDTVADKKKKKKKKKKQMIITSRKFKKTVLRIVRGAVEEHLKRGAGPIDRISLS